MTRSALLRLTNAVDDIYNRVTSSAIFAAEDSVLGLHQVDAGSKRIAQYMEMIMTEERFDRALDDLNERVDSQGSDAQELIRAVSSLAREVLEALGAVGENRTSLRDVLSEVQAL